MRRFESFLEDFAFYFIVLVFCAFVGSCAASYIYKDWKQTLKSETPK